jgi:hypothetical protein
MARPTTRHVIVGVCVCSERWFKDYTSVTAAGMHVVVRILFVDSTAIDTHTNHVYSIGQHPTTIDDVHVFSRYTVK